MGFYIRKSVRVGPLRFNFSKSGMGVSAGIPGFRSGTGPRGHYVHAGAHGFYYRASLGGGAASGTRSLGSTPPGLPAAPAWEPPGPVDPTVGAMVPIESGSVLAMTDQTSEVLLTELRERHARWRSWPAAAIVLMVLFVLVGGRLPDWSVIPFLLVGVLAVIALQQWDALRKTTVIMYDLEHGADAFQRLLDAATGLGTARRLWHVTGSAVVLDGRYHAGAQATIRRTVTRVRMALPPFVKCNLDVPTLAVGRQTLYFFPDRVLVYDAGHVGAVSYGALQLERGTTTFVEEEGVPSDAQVVGHTWRYVNKNGTPDRRFKDNRQIPMALYETLHFRSDTGLNELLHVSRVGAGEALQRTLNGGRAGAPSLRSGTPADAVRR